jgi:hypothetical protein
VKGCAKHAEGLPAGARLWFAALKCGSGKRKNIFSSWPLRKKLAMFFIVLARIAAAFWYAPQPPRAAVSFRRPTMRWRTYAVTWSRISSATISFCGNMVLSLQVLAPMQPSLPLLTEACGADTSCSATQAEPGLLAGSRVTCWLASCISCTQ